MNDKEIRQAGTLIKIAKITLPLSFIILTIAFILAALNKPTNITISLTIFGTLIQGAAFSAGIAINGMQK